MNPVKCGLDPQLSLLESCSPLQ